MGSPRLGAGKLAAIYAGGVLGALARVGLAEVVSTEPGAWPWATLAVNLFGCLLLGYVFARLRDRRGAFAHPFLATGICGTLTTFSTFQFELFAMVDAGRAGTALVYLTVSVVAGLACLRAGLALAARRRRAVMV